MCAGVCVCGFRLVAASSGLWTLCTQIHTHTHTSSSSSSLRCCTHLHTHALTSGWRRGHCTKADVEHTHKLTNTHIPMHRDVRAHTHTTCTYTHTIARARIIDALCCCMWPIILCAVADGATRIIRTMPVGIGAAQENMRAHTHTRSCWCASTPTADVTRAQQTPG